MAFFISPCCRLCSGAPVDQIRNLLDQFEQGDLSAWWKLNQEMTLEPDPSTTDHCLSWTWWRFPCWRDADEATRARLVAAARKDVGEVDPGPSDSTLPRRIPSIAVALGDGKGSHHRDACRHLGAVGTGCNGWKVPGEFEREPGIASWCCRSVLWDPKAWRTSLPFHQFPYLGLHPSRVLAYLREYRDCLLEVFHT